MATFWVIIIMYLIDFIQYFKFISSIMKDLSTKKRSKIILKTKFNTKIKKKLSSITLDLYHTITQTKITLDITYRISN